MASIQKKNELAHLESQDQKQLHQALDSYMSTKQVEDAAHDVHHLRRVAASALSIGQVEGANKRVLLTAAYFHDIVNLPKNHPKRSKASALSAAEALHILPRHFPSVPASDYPAIAHAIEAHSFSAGLSPQTLEAKVLQDADRLEALGAIGIARVFYIAGKLGQSLFDGADPIGTGRELDDKIYAVDHFRAKLLRLHQTMQTETGRRLAAENSAYIIDFLAKLSNECHGAISGLDSTARATLLEGLSS